MAFSVGEYLSKRTKEELEVLLGFCLREENGDAYEYVIEEIYRLLERDAQPHFSKNNE